MILIFHPYTDVAKPSLMDWGSDCFFMFRFGHTHAVKLENWFSDSNAQAMKKWIPGIVYIGVTFFESSGLQSETQRRWTPSNTSLWRGGVCKAWPWASVAVAGWTSFKKVAESLWFVDIKKELERCWYCVGWCVWWCVVCVCLFELDKFVVWLHVLVDDWSLKVSRELYEHSKIGCFRQQCPAD